MSNIPALIVELKKKNIHDPSVLNDIFELVRVYEKEDFDTAHRLSGEIYQTAHDDAIQQKNLAMYELARRALLFDAPHKLDAAMLYAEWDRAPEAKFYVNRYKQLRPVVDALQMLEERKIHLLGVLAPPGIGKLFANDTPVLTRYGWKNHGDLVVGDEVIGMDGQYKRVLFVHPKATGDVRIEFTNGQVLYTHENHEWMVWDRRASNRGFEIKDTKYLMSRILETGPKQRRGHRYTMKLPRREYVQGEHLDLPVMPYTLGVWLGESSNRRPIVTVPKKDENVIGRMIADGYDVMDIFFQKRKGLKTYIFKDKLMNDLNSIGMCDADKITRKYIPVEYLLADVKQRLALLAGLIDRLGSISKNKRKYQIRVTSEEFKDEISDLVSTFGWRISVTEYRKVISYRKIKYRKTIYSITFVPDAEIPCMLERKRNVVGITPHSIYIKSISRCEPREGNCITVEGDGMYLVGEKMVPTHNSTLAIFYMVWSGLRNPKYSILGCSHNNDFLRQVYTDILAMIDAQGEYRWRDIFPYISDMQTDAKSLRLNIGEPKRFDTFQFASIKSGLSGRVRASNLLYVDDLVEGSEEAFSRERMRTLWTKYSVDLLQRQQGDFAQLIIQTPWSVHDPIDRVELSKRDNPDAMFIHLPAMDENDESNFDYPFNLGFTTQQYREIRATMDEISWSSLYMTYAKEREGLLYDADEIRKYSELPKGEPEAIIAACDTKDKGKDYAVLVIAYKYGDDYYIEDFVCDNGRLETIDAKLTQRLMAYGVHVARFESNAAGGRVAEKIQEDIERQGGITKIQLRYTVANKETKIYVHSMFVKEHFLFNEEKWRTDKEYRIAMDFLCSYTMLGKNSHDDVPDAVAMLSEFVQSMTASKVKVGIRPY